MSLRLTLAAVAAMLAFAAPALAQEAAPAVPVVSAAPAKTPSPAEVEMEAKAEAFQARMESLQTELTAVVDGPDGGDEAKRLADADVILARYQPDFDAFATTFEAFLDTQLAAATADDERQELTEARAKIDHRGAGRHRVRRHRPCRSGRDHPPVAPPVHRPAPGGDAGVGGA